MASNCLRCDGITIGVSFGYQLELKADWSDRRQFCGNKARQNAALLAWGLGRRVRWHRAQYANETVAAPEFRTDEISVRAECFPQCGDLNLEVLFAYNIARPRPVEKLLLCDERAVGLQQHQKEVEGPSAKLDRNTVGEQPPPAQQHAETAEFDCCVGSYRTPAGCVVR